MAVCLVLVETSTPPPASHAHALTRTRTHVFHSWIISVILLAVKRVLPNHWARGGEGRAGTLDYRGAHLLQWCFPGRRHNGGCVPADTQHKRWTVQKKTPDPQSPVWFYSRWALNAVRSIAVFFWQAMWCVLTHEVRPPSWQIKPCGQRASGQNTDQTCGETTSNNSSTCTTVYSGPT